MNELKNESYLVQCAVAASNCNQMSIAWNVCWIRSLHDRCIWTMGYVSAKYRPKMIPTAMPTRWARLINSVCALLILPWIRVLMRQGSPHVELLLLWISLHALFQMLSCIFLDPHQADHDYRDSMHLMGSRSCELAHRPKSSLVSSTRRIPLGASTITFSPRLTSSRWIPLWATTITFSPWLASSRWTPLGRTTINSHSSHDILCSLLNQLFSNHFNESNVWWSLDQANIQNLLGLIHLLIVSDLPIWE